MSKLSTYSNTYYTIWTIMPPAGNPPLTILFGLYQIQSDQTVLDAWHGVILSTILMLHANALPHPYGRTYSSLELVQYALDARETNLQPWRTP